MTESPLADAASRDAASRDAASRDAASNDAATVEAPAATDAATAPAVVDTESEAAPEAPPEPPPKPASWTVREPTEPWCPPEAVAPLSALLGAEALASLGQRPAHGSAVHLANAEWLVAGATRRGRRHAHTGAHNEDALHVQLSDSRGVLVVADGAGSARWSRLGSAVAVASIGAALRDASVLSDSVLVDAISGAVTAVRKLAESLNVEARALRTTVLVAAWERSARGVRVHTTQVGDGALVLAHADGRITRPAASDVGDWSGEVHCFLPDEETVARARESALSIDVPDLAAVLLVTDGVDDAFYPFARHAPAILGQLVHGATAPLAGLASQSPTPALGTSDDAGATLLDWLAFEKRGENDDRTLAVALHRTASTGIAPWAPSASD